MAMAVGQPPSSIYLAIYGNDVPGLIGSRLLWESVGKNMTTSSDGLITFETGSNPIIKGYTTVGTVTKPNTFFYIVFAGICQDTSGGYRIFGERITGDAYQLIAKNGSVYNVGTLKSDQYAKDDHFHSVFDYELDDEKMQIIVPYIGFTMTV